MVRNRLIFDTDGGVDDAQALLLLIGNGRAPDAITTVFGNVDVDTATGNVLATLAVAGVAIEVHKGAAEALEQELIHARHVHGEDGLGGAPRPPIVADIAGFDAVGYLVATLEEAARTGVAVDLLMVGPLTNLALALVAAPGIARGIGQLTIMGGTLHGRGNHTPAAEFNLYADPEAAAIVFAADIPTVVVPWEPCKTHYLTGPQTDALFASVPESPYKAFALALAAHSRRTPAGRERVDCMCFVDPLAAAVVVEPGIVTRSLRASVDVALAPGITRGMTVVDPSGRLGTPMVTLVEEADIDRLAALFAASVRGPMTAVPVSTVLSFRTAILSEGEVVGRVIRAAFTPYVRALGRELPADGSARFAEERERFAAELERGDVYVALEGEQIVGAVRTKLREKGLYIHQIAVDPARQGTGVGSWLLDRIGEVARARGLGGLSLETAEMAVANVRLYQRHGFEIVGRGPPDHGLDPHTRVYMVKSL